MIRFDRRGLRLATISIAALVAGMGGAASAQDKITLTFANWAAAEGTTRPGIEKVIADFEAANPEIDVVSEAISFSEIARQLVLRARSGNPPDVAQIAGNDTVLLAFTGALEPLDGYVKENLAANLKQGADAGLRDDGGLFAFPWNQSPAGFWYNKEIMQKAGLDPNKPPRTIDELTAALAAIKSSQPDVIPLAIDTTNRAFALSSNWPWMKSFGAVPVGEGATGAESAEMKAYLSWMRKIAQAGYIDPGRRIGEFRPLAAQGHVAFIWDQVLLKGVMQGASKMSDDDFYKTWGVTTLPAGAGKPTTFEGGHQLVMFASGKQKEAAWKFIEYLATSPDAIANYTMSVNSSLPSIKATGKAELDAALGTPVFKAFSDEIIPTLAPQPYGPDFAAAATAIMAGVQEAVTGSQPIDDIAASIQLGLPQ
ncbi:MULTISPECIES: extracellular solute-binding protein [unclassified Sinorhizobium]|uniref:ABC transporter substrate-binding protein n=1 Tax=unclassified Sinorhizobium TaxID=2613772 RepID=UPI0024C40EEB|nr:MULTISPECIES: extracellular solute-binding protein [unclassified Sinorhizobium]MDK1377295.1 extracellular solute-binding protein [Sinorhizobium sp. 6-70]MDK1481906.1 extracellular solute-binding protein [Sinorhizobium sp. 6-117]